MPDRLLLLLIACAVSSAQGIFIEGASVLDGLGGAAKAVHVRIEVDRIVAVGEQIRPAAGDQIIAAKGLILAPGFIDLHNHSDRGLGNDPSAASQVSQGITTAVIGVDGGSSFPIADWVKRRRETPASINILTMVGHATVRSKVMSKDYKRKANGSEIDSMATLVDQAMREGAVGLSSGLEYEVGSYSAT
jgi:N-acyl-D-amino-acid deacylase